MSVMNKRPSVLIKDAWKCVSESLAPLHAAVKWLSRAERRNEREEDDGCEEGRKE